MKRKTVYGLGGSALGFLFGGLDAAALAGGLSWLYGNEKYGDQQLRSSSNAMNAAQYDFNDAEAQLDRRDQDLERMADRYLEDK